MANLIKNKKDIKRIKTYIEGFDDQIEGGVPEGSICLVAGGSGTMKSSLSFNVLYNEILLGKKAMYLSLEQSPTSLLNQMVALGYDLSLINYVILSDLSDLDEVLAKVKTVKKGVLMLTDMSAIRKELKELKQVSAESDWLNVIKNIVNKLNDAKSCDLFVLDSMSALYAVSNFKEDPRTKLFFFFEFLRDSDITSFLITEMFENEKIGEYGVEDYLSDAIIKLQMMREGRRVRREISVAKMRATDANMDIFILNFVQGKFRALSKLPV